MSWGRPLEILTSDVYCPYCARQGIGKKFACDLHSWAYRGWYRGLQCAFGLPLLDKQQRGFFAKRRDG